MDDKLRSEIERIVEEGEAIRDRVRQTVEVASEDLSDSHSRLLELSRATVEAAVAAIERATPADPASTLHQVVDGLGDGLQRTAQATALAVEEASGKGRAYATGDLKQVSDDLLSLTRMFADTVEQGVRVAAQQTWSQLSGVRQHAERTMAAIGPSLHAAAKATAKDPIGLARESATAATKLSHEATGALFATIGRLLRTAGDHLDPTGRSEVAGDADASSSAGAPGDEQAK